MLIDEVQITLSGGHGGPGKVSFFPFMGGPDGGNGGRGGDVYLTVNSDIYSLGQFSQKKSFTAHNGDAGQSNQKSGHNGQDISLSLPLGTTLVEINTGETIELTDLSQRVLVCKGGIGGQGNHDLKSARNTTPMKAQGGRPGELKEFKLTLRLIADYGLIGLPNAGKTSLLNELTNAQAKVGNYPFTTLEPNLGAINDKIIADIPGLIEGAATGKGLGIRFLKHIEKVNLLFHCISSESQNVKQDYEVVRKELNEFNPELLLKPEIILLTKTDLFLQEEIKKKISILKKLNPKVWGVSIVDEAALKKIREELI